MRGTFTAMIRAFGAGDIDAMRPLLAWNMVGYVTNADGGADQQTPV
jgi:hypothetical protein